QRHVFLSHPFTGLALQLAAVTMNRRFFLQGSQLCFQLGYLFTQFGALIEHVQILPHAPQVAGREAESGSEQDTEYPERNTLALLPRPIGHKHHLRIGAAAWPDIALGHTGTVMASMRHARDRQFPADPA